MDPGEEDYDQRQTGSPAREVLRLEVGARIVVLDGSGLEYLVELLDITSGRVTTEVVKCYPCANEPGMQITLYQALLKGSSFDLVLQKCSEIGVVDFVLMICERCIVILYECGELGG